MLTATPRVSFRGLAEKIGMSDARVRQIVNGYASTGPGLVAEVRGPAETVAQMAHVLKVAPEKMAAAGRDDVAELLVEMAKTLSTPDPGGDEADLDARIASVELKLDQIMQQIDELTSQRDEGGGAHGNAAPMKPDLIWPDGPMENEQDNLEQRLDAIARDLPAAARRGASAGKARDDELAGAGEESQDDGSEPG